MRTPEQIMNLRNVLSTFLGPFAFVASDRDINKFADNIQRAADMRDPAKHNWKIRVRLEDNKDKPWEEITPEPNEVEGRAFVVSESARHLLDKHPGIIAIRIEREGGSFREIERY